MAIVITDRTSKDAAPGSNVILKSYRKNGKVYFHPVRTFLDQRRSRARKPRRTGNKPSTANTGRTTPRLEEQTKTSDRPPPQSMSRPNDLELTGFNIERTDFDHASSHQGNSSTQALPKIPSEPVDMPFANVAKSRKPQPSTMHDQEVSLSQVDEQLHTELLQASDRSPIPMLADTGAPTVTLPTRPKARAGAATGFAST